MARFDTSTGGGLRSQLETARGQLALRWRQLGERERFVLGALAVVLGLLLGWSLLIAPALRTLKGAPAELERLEAQLQQMQAQAAEARTLRAAPTVPPAQAQAALKASVDHLGASARLSLSGDRAIVTLNDIAPQALQAWLGEARAAARARPVEAQLTRGPRGYSGSVTLSLGDS
jgi:general secretion pathway protein M